MSEVVTTVERNLRKTKAGVVTSNKGDKSITVKVERKVKHPLYGKFVKKSTKFHAHDEKNARRAGGVSSDPSGAALDSARVLAVAICARLPGV
jgi:small subunit ribosomal protein S17